MRLRAPPSPMDWRRQQRTVATPPDDPTAWLGGPPSDFLLRHSLLPPRGPPGRLLRAETATASSQTGSAPSDRHPGPAVQPVRDPPVNNSTAWLGGPPTDHSLRHCLLPPQGLRVQIPHTGLVLTTSQALIAALIRHASAALEQIGRSTVRSI